MTAPAVPGYPYGPVYRNGQRVFPEFVEDPQDYIGQHRVQVVTDPFTDTTEVTLIPLVAGERWEVGLDYEPKHAAAEVAS